MATASSPERAISLVELAARGTAVLAGVEIFEDDDARMAALTGVEIFEDDARIGIAGRVVARLDDVAYLIWGSPIEVVPLQARSAGSANSASPPSDDDDGDGDGDDDGGGDRDEDEEDDWEPASAGERLWSSLEGDPEGMERLLGIVGGATMPPVVVSLVLWPARGPAAGSGAGAAIGTPERKSTPSGRPDEASERLSVIDERSGLLILEIGLEQYDAIDTSRNVMPLRSHVRILPDTQAQITHRPQRAPFRPERLIIGGTPADWIVNDVRIGTRSQLAYGGDLPGEVFSASALDTILSFDAVQAGQDLALTVTYVGRDPAGAEFVGAFVGSAVDRFRRVTCLAACWTPEGRRQGWMIGVEGEGKFEDLGGDDAAVPIGDPPVGSPG